MADLSNKIRPGDPITADFLNSLRDAGTRKPVDLRAGPGINLRQSADGCTQISASTRSSLVGKVSGSAVTAISSSTPGSGTVEVYNVSQATGNLTDAGYTITVNNLGAGIAVGQWVWIEEDSDGYWWVRPTSATVYWCQFSSTVSAASGTWPSLTLGSASGVTIYVVSGGALVSVGTATVYNTHAVSFAASKTTAVAPNGDGTYSIIDQDC